MTAPIGLSPHMWRGAIFHACIWNTLQAHFGAVGRTMSVSP